MEERQRRPSEAWKRKSARSYAGEIGISENKAYDVLFGPGSRYEAYWSEREAKKKIKPKRTYKPNYKKLT